MKKTLWKIFTCLLILSMASTPVFAAVTTDATYTGIVRVTNNGTANTSVAVPFTANTTVFIDGGFMASNATNTAITSAAGADIRYMPAYNGTTDWIVAVPSIGDTTVLDNTLFMGGSTDMESMIRYFPDTSGMAVPDDATLEISDNFTHSIEGYFDASVTGNLTLKHGAFRLTADGSGNVTAAIISENTTTPDVAPTANGIETNITSADTNHWADVSDNNTATGVWNINEWSFERDYFVTANITATAYPIDYVSVSVQGQAVGAPCDGEAYPWVYTNSTSYNGSLQVYSCALTTNTYTWNTNPNTGLPWTYAEVNDMQIGVSIRTPFTANQMEVRELWGTVSYGPEIVDLTVSASGITTGEHAIAVVADGSYLNLGVDADVSALSRTIQPIVGGGWFNYLPQTGDGIRYTPVMGQNFLRATENTSWQIVTTDGEINGLFVELDTAPGGGNSWLFTVRVNSADTGVSVNISDANTTGNTTASVAVSQGDLLSMSITPAGGSLPATGTERWATEFISANNNESIMLGNTFTNAHTSSTRYFPVNASDANWLQEGEANTPMPTAGTISNLFVYTDQPPGGTGTYTFTLRKNQANTGLTATLGASDTSANDTANAVTFAAGDNVSIAYTPAGSPAIAPVFHWGLTFTADTVGQSIVSGGQTNAGISATPNENTFNFVSAHSAGWAGSVTTCLQLTTATTYSDFYVRLQNAVGAGENLTFTLVANSANTSVTVDLDGTTLTASDTVNSFAVSDGDTISINAAASDNSSLGAQRWAFVATNAPYLPAGINRVALAGNSVPDVIHPWAFANDDVMLYISSVNVSAGGSLAGGWAWQNGSTFTDASGNGNTATPTFRTISTDPDISAELLNFGPYSEADAPAYSINISTSGWITENISVTGDFTTNTTTADYPGSAVVVAVSVAGNTPASLPTLLFGAAILVSLSVFVSWLMRRNQERSLLFKMLLVAGGIGVFVAVSAFDDWLLYLFLMISIAIVTAASTRTFSGTGNAGNNMLGFLSMAFVGMTMISRILEGRFIQSTDVDIVRNVVAFQPFSVFGLFTIPVPNTDFITNGIPALMRWDYSFFGGNAQIVQYLLYSITAVVSFMLFVLVFGAIYQMFSRR